MNFYKRFIGDIQAKTGGLSLAEFGAYDRLLDHYYSTEQPVPTDEIYRICRAMSGAERAAVDRVLAKFFDHTPEGYTQSKADEVIAKALPLIEAARVNGKRGGRPPKNKTQQKPSGFQNDNPAETQQEPSAKANQSQSQIPEEITPSLSTTVEGVQPTDAGLICKAMKAVGIADVNPGHQTLRTLLEAGADVAEFVGAAQKAVAEQKGFAYALGIVKNERLRAAQLTDQIHRGALPVAETAYQRSMRERMQEAAPEAARKDPSHAAHAADFFNAIEVPTRTVERIR